MYFSRFHLQISFRFVLGDTQSPEQIERETQIASHVDFIMMNIESAIQSNNLESLAVNFSFLNSSITEPDEYDLFVTKWPKIPEVLVHLLNQDYFSFEKLQGEVLTLVINILAYSFSASSIFNDLRIIPTVLHFFEKPETRRLGQVENNSKHDYSSF